MSTRKTKIDQKKFLPDYLKFKDKYDKLGTNLSLALELLLKESGINHLEVDYRIKEENSFLEKIERKQYKNPFEEMEDICGIRIICYYQSDVEKISQLIIDELDTLENQDKEELLKPDQFGYRSTHLIVKIKDNWLEATNYRGLENLKTEIQIRTVLMHAWAEIEHKLAYKKETHVPNQFKRKLYRISAKLEEADEQFEELRNSINEYKNNVIQISGEVDNIENIELNLDSLQAYFDKVFPDRKKNVEMTSEVVDEMNKAKINLNDFIKFHEKIKSHLQEIEQDDFDKTVTPVSGWAQVGAARTILDIFSEKYAKSRGLLDYRDQWKKYT